MDALRPVKPWRTKAPVRIRPSGIAALGETTTRGDAGTLLNAATTAKTHMAEILSQHGYFDTADLLILQFENKKTRNLLYFDDDVVL